MNTIYNNIGLFSVLLLAGGWLVHMYALFAYISAKKGKVIGFRWYARNRPSLMKKSILMAGLFGLVAYVYYDPSHFDLAVDAERKEFATYLAVLILIGGGSSFVMDMARKATGSAQGQNLEVEEDGRTMILGDEERQKIIESERRKAEESEK